jgi:hypothetical protein
MIAEEQGRHCLACSKTVVDFTNWEADDILNYLKAKSKERVCGRFNTAQLDNNEIAETEQLVQTIWQSAMPLLRKIAAVIVLCFGLLNAGDANAQKKMGKVACPKPERTEQMQGEIAIKADTVQQIKLPRLDTMNTRPQIMGIIAPYHPKKVKVTKPASVKKKSSGK